MADQVKGVTLKIGAKTGTSGKIFGSVTNVQIAQALKEQCNLEVERKKITIPEEVKNVGGRSAALTLFVAHSLVGDLVTGQKAFTEGGQLTGADCGESGASTPA